MLSLTHTVISLPFAYLLENPVTIFFAAALLHPLTDMLPHWNIYPDKFSRFPYGLVALDVIGGLVLAALLVGDAFFTLPVLAAIAGGNVPDIAHTLWLLCGGARNQHRLPRWLSAPFRLHDRIQFEVTSPVRGLISQIIAMIITVTLLGP